jgi:hypothetical protein
VSQVKVWHSVFRCAQPGSSLQPVAQVPSSQNSLSSQCAFSQHSWQAVPPQQWSSSQQGWVSEQAASSGQQAPSRQAFPQSTPSQTQSPPAQSKFGLQESLHDPQWRGSFRVSMQLLPQQVFPAAQSASASHWVPNVTQIPT